MDDRKRKRGIKASRNKLEAAMLARGFETQAALAQQIALNEGIDKAPRDLVNKVFREQAVSPHNLARIALALQVEVHTIYMSQDDKPLAQIHSKQNIQPNKASFVFSKKSTYLLPSSTSNNLKASRYSIGILGVLLCISIVAMGFNWLQQETHKAQNPRAKLVSSIGKALVVIQAPDDLQQFGTELVTEISAMPSINATMLTSQEAYSIPPAEALLKWQAHGVLRLEYQKRQFYIMVTATFTTANYKNVILQKIMHNSELTHDIAVISADIRSQIQQFVDGNMPNPVITSSAESLQLLLLGKEQLFTSRSEKDFSKASKLFNQAAHEDPEFSAVYAELCRTYVRISWIHQETPSLERAADYCRHASDLPHSVATVTANAELLARTGRLEQALALITANIPLDTANADTLALLAALQLEQFERDRRDTDKQLIEANARKAILRTPRHWQALNTLGNLYFMTGNVQQAKVHFAKASEIVKHDVILANLGTLQMCHDELEDAEKTYRQLITSFENNYLGHESLGKVYHFQRRFELSLQQQLFAIDKQPEVAIHHVWADLAGTYLKLEQDSDAKKYYLHALTLLERDELLENISSSDQVHKLYYQTKLLTLTNNDNLKDKLNDKSEQAGLLQARTQSLSIRAKSHLAWILDITGNPDTSKQLWQEISTLCPVYLRSAALATEQNNP
ncbi:tetratricopeptide repeat protein [Arsukibacterium indicum]|uniref:Tetratricopeptide repeat protein n=1 Tax=Arsukibacterium indicum TaxID=2848612 RepID=A0ABS6MQQ1_9GAMM|nr:hypothetical protein [Arsukibacterium indicum]MBV2131065.1 hypothetical protein [Arsukibacterium indicum]